MSSKNSKQRTLASRLTIWNAAIYIVFFGSAFLLFYLSISNILHNLLDEDMVEDITDFRMLLEEDGFSGVTTEIKREIYADGPENSFFRVMDKNGNTVFSSDLSPWDEAGVDPDLLEQMAEGSDPVLVTIAAPDRDYDVRVVYGWIGPDMMMQTGESVIWRSSGWPCSLPRPVFFTIRGSRSPFLPSFPTMVGIGSRRRLPIC